MQQHSVAGADRRGDIYNLQGKKAEAKAEAWRTLLEDRSLSEAMLEAVMRQQVAERRVPGRSRRAHRVAGRRLDVDDTRTEPEELAARVGARQVAREVDDEVSCERLHGE